MNRRLFIPLFALSFLLPAFAQQPAKQSPAPNQQQAAPPVIPPPIIPPNEQFLRTADEVLLEMSKLIALPAKGPLKKTLRSRDEIRAYVLRRLAEEQKPEETYADQKSLEKFGLIPRGFDLESFIVDLLTEQIQGLYDPESREFFIADWIPLAEQRMVMAHELVHALQDQHYNLDSWMKAVKENDDATFARAAVAEGSATAAMLQYITKIPVQDMPDLGKLMQGAGAVDPQQSPLMAKAPMFIRDSLLFPYAAGASFAQQVLKAGSGWESFPKVFQNPPVTTQQILHPELYLKGIVPPTVTLKLPKPLTAAPWKMLDESVLGEFGLHSLLKQTLGQERAERLSPSWSGDRYAVLENSKTKIVLLVARFRLSDVDSAALFFGPMSEALELKYETRTGLFRRPNFFQFSTPAEESNFLYCVAADCLLVEGADRKLFDSIVRAQGWILPPAPTPGKPQSTITAASADPTLALAHTPPPAALHAAASAP